MDNNIKGIITTIPSVCKRCYSCIRECPAKAIRVENGQAVVVLERCIVCGHCVKVCSQEAKRILSYNDFVLNELLGKHKTIAIVAPSFAASFFENYKKLPTALRKLGFNKVVETAFGADLVSELYKKELHSDKVGPIISSACPAVNNFIQKYFTSLVPNIAQIVSPMIALGRFLKHTEGEDTKVVFIGPCVAKEDEFQDEEVQGAIDAVLKFSDIKEILNDKNIELDKLEDSFFDPPYANLGKAYPLAGGLLKSINVNDDILAKDIIVVEGKAKVVEIIEELWNNHINAKFIDILFCEGCISGPSIDSRLNYYSRRKKVVEYIEEAIKLVDLDEWQKNMEIGSQLDLTRTFTPKRQRKPLPSEEKIREILNDLNKQTPKEELNCGACGYNTCREFAIAVGKGLAEKEMCMPFLIEKLEKAYEELRTTQEQLHSAEKLASIGQLAAGVAHEINNPLGTIMLYATLLQKSIKKITDDNSLTNDLNLIINETNRCKNIVSNLLNFARQGKLNITSFNMSELVNEVIRKIGINPKYQDCAVEINTPISGSMIDGDKEQLEQVLTNIIVNGIEAMEEMEEKKLTINIKNLPNDLEVQIIDRGTGIPKENYSKLFTPFFTTKKIGKGTGLGLAIAYGIIKMHKGDITFESEVGKGTKFLIKLPKNLKIDNPIF